MVIASRTKRKDFRRVHSRISSQPSHGKILGSGRKGGTNTRCVKRVKFAVNRGIKTIHRVLTPDSQAEIPGRICALAVMTKAPRAGQVKTRLVPPLTHTEAAELNSCFLRDISAAILVASCSAGVGSS